MIDYPMPVQGATWAAEVDWINAWISNVSIFCIVVITAVMIDFAIRYRRSKYAKATSSVDHNAALETLWTAIPTVVVLYVFWIGFVVYKDMREPPMNPVELNVTAQKWFWLFEYENGKQTNEFVVPVNRPVRLIMRSKDVNHSFFIPAMRVKEDVIGSQYNYLWFEPNKIGEYPVFCAEYCGLKHYAMSSTLRVVTQQDYQDFLLDRTSGEQVELSPVEHGKKLWQAKGCNACHSLDGSAVVGPTFKGLYGAKRDFTDGTSETADENYLRESILNPSKRVVNGFAPVMPAYEGLVKDEEINQIIALIKSLNPESDPAATDSKEGS